MPASSNGRGSPSERGVEGGGGAWAAAGGRASRTERGPVHDSANALGCLLRRWHGLSVRPQGGGPQATAAPQPALKQQVLARALGDAHDRVAAALQQGPHVAQQCRLVNGNLFVPGRGERARVSRRVRRSEPPRRWWETPSMGATSHHTSASEERGARQSGNNGVVVGTSGMRQASTTPDAIDAMSVRKPERRPNSCGRRQGGVLEAPGSAAGWGLCRSGAAPARAAQAALAAGPDPALPSIRPDRHLLPPTGHLDKPQTPQRAGSFYLGAHERVLRALDRRHKPKARIQLEGGGGWRGEGWGWAAAAGGAVSLCATGVRKRMAGSLPPNLQTLDFNPSQGPQ